MTEIATSSKIDIDIKTSVFVVTPDDDIRSPSLITSNMKLYNKFILRYEAKEVLNRVIELEGCEDLIPVINTRTILDKYM